MLSELKSQLDELVEARHIEMNYIVGPPAIAVANQQGRKNPKKPSQLN